MGLPEWQRVNGGRLGITFTAGIAGYLVSASGSQRRKDTYGTESTSVVRKQDRSTHYGRMLPAYAPPPALQAGVAYR